jgi:3-dehydroquinate dehydratase type I
MALPDVDRVAVVIGRTRHKMVVVELEEAVRRGAQFIELRLDFLSKAVDFTRLAPHKHCPWLATFRRVDEGGRHPCKEEERIAVLRQAIVSGHFEWVDLETDIADGVRRFGKVRRVISYHNMKETPEDLDSIYERMLRQDGDVYKLAVMTNTVADLEKVLRLQKSAPKPTIAFGMGDLGLPTRYTALKYGAPWIYAAFNRERGVDHRPRPALPRRLQDHLPRPLHQREDRNLRPARRSGRAQFQPDPAQPHVPADEDERDLPAVPRAAGRPRGRAQDLRYHPGERL